MFLTNVEHASLSPASSTSTDRYDTQEPFMTFQHKVRQLCQTIGLGSSMAIEHIRGGSFNRIVGITYPSSSSARACILRIPRSVFSPTHATEMLSQIAITRHLASHLPPTVSVPTTLAYDITTNNPLKSQYVLQTRVPGVPLSNVWEDDGLLLEERLQIVRLIAAVVGEIERVEFEGHGRLIPSTPLSDRCDDFPRLTADGGDGVAVAPFRIDGQDVLIPTKRPIPLKTLLTTLIEAWITEMPPPPPAMLQKWLQLRQIMVEMGDMGWLDDTTSVLCHWDFAARNIMVEQTGGEGKGKEVRVWKITGIIDWDGALSVPRVLARKPPSWLWHIGDEPSGWTGDVDMLVQRPLTVEEKLIKTHFEKAVEKDLGDGYCEDAYGRGLWTRRLARFALDGFVYSQDWERYRIFVNEWRTKEREGMGDGVASRGVTQRRDAMD